MKGWLDAAWEQYMTRIGRRGLMLFILAIMFGLYGITLIIAPPHAGWWPALQGVVLGIPTGTWGLIWVGGSIFLLLGAPLDRDQAHFALASGMYALWGFSAILNSPYAGPGITYTGLALLVLLASGWPDPKTTRSTRHVVGGE